MTQLSRLMRLYQEAKKPGVYQSLGLETPAAKMHRIRKENSPAYRDGMKDGESAHASGFKALVHDPHAFKKWQAYGLSSYTGEEYAQGWQDGHAQTNARA